MAGRRMDVPGHGEDRGYGGDPAQARNAGTGRRQPNDASWKPQGYPTVAPCLVVAGADREIEFLVRALDADRLRRFPAPDGSVPHAEVRTGDTVVMLGDAGGDWPPAPCHLHVYVEDVDAVYARALDLGATGVQAPAQKEPGDDRRGGFRSPGGNTWCVATLPGGGIAGCVKAPGQGR